MSIRLRASYVDARMCCYSCCVPENPKTVQRLDERFAGLSQTTRALAVSPSQLFLLFVHRECEQCDHHGRAEDTSLGTSATIEVGGGDDGSFGCPGEEGAAGSGGAPEPRTGTRLCLLPAAQVPEAVGNRDGTEDVPTEGRIHLPIGGILPGQLPPFRGRAHIPGPLGNAHNNIREDMEVIDIHRADADDGHSPFARPNSPAWAQRGL